MCGIAGILIPEHAPACPAGRLENTVRAMADTMAHRGPDGDGAWADAAGRVAFGHRRLSIVDLSETARQPMCNEDGSVWITYNGEVYNHAPLRRELEAAGHTFKSHHSDTEVLVHGYEQWGLRGLVARLEGMFAFAIWDARAKRLSLVRDRVGIKPLYFTQAGGDFRFASEIKALLADGTVPRGVEGAALNHYLSFMVAPAPLTMFKDVFKLPAGHVMEVDAAGTMRAERYWDAVPGDGATQDPAACARTVRTLLEAAIEKRMMADVPFGVFLSGGIDSTANVALMSQIMDRPVETFTVGFKDHERLNELQYARLAAETFKTNHHEVLIDEADMVGYLDDLVHQQDEPIADWVCVPLYFVSKLARDSGVPVVQVGEGSDEQFCGYDSWMTYLKTHQTVWPLAKRLPRPLARGASVLAAAFGRDKEAEVLRRAATGRELFWSGANAFWNVHKDRLGLFLDTATDFSALAAAGLDVTGLPDRDTGAVVDAYLKPFDSRYPGCDQLTRMTYAEFRLRLPELLLMRVDKITMSTSVEGRVPFLDHALVEATMGMGQSVKLGGGRQKALLKDALSGLLPDAIVNRPKMGFAAPMREWLQGDFGHKARAAVLGSALMADGVMDRDVVAAMFADHMDGRRDNALHLWTLFNLTAWHDHWIAA